MSGDQGDGEAEAAWLLEQRSKVETFVERHDLDYGALPERPVWFIASSLSVWAVTSNKRPGAVGWWVVSGKVPTDYVSGYDAVDARGALASLARHWTSMAGYTFGKELSVLSAEEQREVRDRARSDIRFLQECAEDDRLW